jgi:hypothetical protein
VGDARLVRVDWVSNTDLVERPYRYWSTGCTTNQRGAGDVHLPDHELSGRCRRPWAARVDTDGSAVVAATSRHDPSNRNSRSAASVQTSDLFGDQRRHTALPPPRIDGSGRVASGVWRWAVVGGGLRARVLADLQGVRAGVHRVQNGVAGVVDGPGGEVYGVQRLAFGPVGVAFREVGVDAVAALVRLRLELVHLG